MLIYKCTIATNIFSVILTFIIIKKFPDHIKIQLKNCYLTGILQFYRKIFCLTDFNIQYCQKGIFLRCNFKI